MTQASGDTLSRRIGDAAQRWGLGQFGLIAETATSHVFSVERGCAPAALKLLKPYGAEEIAGARLMVWYGGRGAARIDDTTEDAVLMEYLDGPPLGDLARSGHDEQATDILCDVAAMLHERRDTAPPSLEDLGERFRPLFESQPEDWPQSHRALFARAAQIGRELLASSQGRAPLHGDFHHDNVLSSARGWLAIDAKGVVGDRAYEFANVFRNPLGGAQIARERIEARAARIAARTGLDKRRVLQWAAAHSALSACWDRAAGNPVECDLEMLPLLLAAADGAPPSMPPGRR